jgi:glycosyltransferase involved in cell wall biosynthesis
MKTPRVSVILPCYNAEPYLRETVGSLRAQTYQDFEVVAVNDGSADRTGELLDELTREWNAGSDTLYPKMRVIHQKNAGLARARNVAIEVMTGEYIALLDSDDLWVPEKLSECMAFFAANPSLSIVYTPMQPFNGETGEMMEGHSKPCHAGQLTEKLFLSIFVHDPAAVFHRRVIDACGGFCEDIPVSIGHEFWLRVAPHFEFGLIDEPLALRRWTEDSLTRRNRLRGRQIKARILERFYFELGGKGLIPKRHAMKRLAKVNYHAGKILLKELRGREATPYLAKALRYHPTYWRVYPQLLASLLIAIVR